MSLKDLGAVDPHSFARPDDSQIEHIHLDLGIDFEKQIFSGSATLTIDWKNKNAKELMLDTRELIVTSASWKNGDLQFRVDEPVLAFGSRLVVHLPDTKDNKLDITIHYSTAPTATALQWLRPDQTLGKKLPYLFSQCEAIHCRSIIPCQDTPAVKVTYTANITATTEITVLMSAVRDTPQPSGFDSRIHRFRQDVPIPSYLIAIAAGALESRRIGPRSHIWSEKEMIEKAAWEFADTEKIVSAAESIVGPYVWGVYDILVLPPSFAYGGMENPCLTFATPIVVVGDRSLVSLIAHEAAHSWTGNLVTTKTFEHFWLNEGFTTFLERKINARLYGEKERHFNAIGGLKTLSDCITSLGEDSPITKLNLHLTGVDPDTTFTVVPYEKGHTFLFYLETKLGGPKVFDGFLRAYIDNFKYKSITTEDFKSFLFKYFKNEVEAGALDDVDWDAWFNKPGMPPVIPKYDTTLADSCTALMNRWLQWDPDTEPCPFTDNDFENFTTKQVIVFLCSLLDEEPLPVVKVQKMEDVYKFNSSSNADLLYRWLRLCLKAKWKDQASHVVKFLSYHGRMRYIRPLYKDLFLWDETKQLALDTFSKYRDSIMILAANLVAQDLGVTL